MKMLKMALAASVVAGTVAISAAPAHAVIRTPVAGSGMSAGTVWWIMACPAGVVTAALAKNWKRHAELTAPEAWTCGLQYWWNEATGQYDRKPVRRHRRH